MAHIYHRDSGQEAFAMIMKIEENCILSVVWGGNFAPDPATSGFTYMV